jgi:hypothetical protein
MAFARLSPIPRDIGQLIERGLCEPFEAAEAPSSQMTTRDWLGAYISYLCSLSGHINFA